MDKPINLSSMSPNPKGYQQTLNKDLASRKYSHDYPIHKKNSGNNSNKSPITIISSTDTSEGGSSISCTPQKLNIAEIEVTEKRTNIDVHKGNKHNKFKEKASMGCDSSIEAQEIKYLGDKEVEVHDNKLDSNDIESIEALLDSLYGNEWRKKQYQVLPMSAPRERRRPQKNNIDKIGAASIAKDKIASYNDKKIGNKHLNIGSTPHVGRSPWQEELKHLCDTDTESSDAEKNGVNFVGLKNVKTKLNFKENNVEQQELPKSKNKHKTRKQQINDDRFDDIESSSSDDEDYDNNVTKIYEERRKTIIAKPSGSSQYASFLESLSVRIPINKCDMSARIFRINYAKFKDELVKKLFNLYNEKVFNGAIPNDSKIEWNAKLTRTAGLCRCKRITRRNGDIEKMIAIELSTKVLDCSERLRDTLIHEMCHAATWMVNNVNRGHGDYWKQWAFKAMTVLSDIPPIKRCHTYTINTKYTYKCIECGYSIGRHSKSLDITRKRCGYCGGKFEILINKTLRTGEVKTVASTPTKPTKFALFVKENYALYKEPMKQHGDVMKILGQKFKEINIKTTS